MFIRTFNHLIAVLLCTMICMLAGCGADGTPTQATGVGSVALNLAWNGDKIASKAVKAPASVTTIQIVISGPSMTPIQQNFAASSGGGTISSVPAGSGLTVTAYALDASGGLLYRGTVGNITVTAGQTTDVATVIMLSVPSLSSITVTPANTRLAVNATQQFKATGTFTNMSTVDLTTVATWRSSAASIATIAASGMATALTNGSATITASSGTLTGTTTLTVSSATLVSLTIQPANPSIAIGSNQQFSATGTFSDNTTQDLTSSATWSSSATAVASIANLTGSAGRASADATGTTTITAAVPITQPIQGSISGSTTLTVTGTGAQANVMPITVNGSLCSSATSSGYSNKPCVSVTVCNPDGSNCQVINDILLDTGSYGLRIFQSALGNLSLTQETSGTGSLAECVGYVDGSANWGPVQVATVILGGEPAVQVPIQVINSSFGSLSSRALGRVCSGAVATPQEAGYAGILGVGLLTQDCGNHCSSSTGNGMYYACTGSTCNGAAAPLANQVTNPVALLPQDNNGVLVQLPSVPLGGVSSLNGALILGVGTRSNNNPSGATAYPANSLAEFTTSFQGQSSGSSFIDSGSNALYFSAPSSLLPQDYYGFFSPAVAVGSALSFSAINSGDLGTPSGSASFQIGNFDSLENTGNNVFSETGGYQTGGFDWGLPFFFGRNVFIGFDGTNSTLGTGPYWAY